MDMTTGTENPEKTTQQAGYYARPEIGGEAGSYRRKRWQRRRELRKSAKALSGLEKTYQEDKKALDLMQGYLKNISAQYQANPNAQLATKYERIYAQYSALSKKARSSYYDYLREKDVYDGAAAKYNAANTAYSDYMKAQKGQYDAWRGTIRDQGSIQADIDAIQAQISAQKEADRAARQAAYEAAQDEKPWYEKLAGYLGGVQDTTLPTYSPAMGTGDTRQASEAMKELLAKQALLQEEYDWSQYFRYADLMQADDFKKLSGYSSTANGRDPVLNGLSGMYTETGFDDLTYDYINRNEDARGKALVNSIGDNTALLGVDKSYLQQMTDDEIAIFNYLYATQGADAAYTYTAYLTSSLNQRKRQQEESYWANFANENPVGASVFSVLESPLKGLSYIGQFADLVADGEIDQNAGYNKFSYANSAIRNEVSKKIEESGNWGKVGSFAYQTGMSMGDFLLNTALSGGNSALALTIMGTGAAADTTLAAKDRGLNDGQAFALGTVAGLAEAFTEKFSLEALLDASSLGKSAAGYIAKNMLAEGSEEGASSMIKLFADILISKDKSQWSQSIKAYEAQGMDEGRAFGRALWDQVKAIGLDAFGGALSGGLMAAPGAGIHAAINRAQNAQQTAQAQQAEPPATFQEEIQRQMTENMEGQKPAQSGTVRLEDMQVEIDQATFQQGQRLAQALGRDVVFYTADGNENGYYENGVIYVNTRGNDPLLQVFSHELTHSIEGTGSYGELSRTVLTLMENSGVDLDVARQAKKDLYARNGKKLESTVAVDQELVAEYVSKYLLTDEASITSLVQNHRSLGQRIRNWFDKTLALFGNKNAQERAFLGRARDLYIKALGQTQGSFAQENAGMTAPMGESTAENAQVAASAEPAEAATEIDDEVAEGMRQVEEAYARGEIDDATYDLIMDEYERYREEQATASERKYSISEIQGQKESYGQGVILDTDIFDGVRPRAWGSVLSDYVYNNLAGAELTVYDESGNSETIYLAKATDRVRKDGAKNSHKVLDKLAGYRGDSVRAKAIVQMSEVLATSKNEKTTDEHSHQWMDENGWIIRKAYLQTLDGDIYEATLNIADGRDRKILYEINQVHWVDKKETSASIPSTDNSQRSRYQEPGMGGAQSEVYDGSVPDTEQKVKGNKGRQYSISEEPVSKKDVASDLRAILKRGGNVQELRQYVTQLERSGKNAEHKGTSAEQTRSEAERIIKNAKQQKISVEEYLRQNWEQYDQDGQWNADARKALELEQKAGRQYSITESSDQAYLDAVNRGDMEAAQKMVDQAAKAAGYDSPLLYHGTKSFGFTEFDLSKMDDKRSIFLTDNERIAATYSGVMGKRNVSGEAMKSAEELSAAELVEELNSDRFGAEVDADDKYRYSYLSLKDINQFISNVNSEIDALQGEVAQLIRRYADRMAEDFDSKDQRTHEQLVKLERSLRGYAYKDISTQLYMLLHYTDAFNGTKADASRIAKLEQDIRLFNKLEHRDNSDGAIVESWLNGYSLSVLGEQQARDKLKVKRKTGNYGMYAKLGKQFVVDCKGSNWNDITYQEVLPDGLKSFYPNGLWQRGTTRDVAEYAQRNGYDSVIFRNLRDNGGNNAFVSIEEEADIYVLFNPEQAKSADPVTYDDQGDVIPLSQRFNEAKGDIRYSISEDAEVPEAEVDIRSTMPKKAKDYLKRVERELLWTIADKLSVPKLAGREYLQPIIQELSDEYLKEGAISQDSKDLLFEKAYAQAVIVDAEFYNEYKHIKDHLRNTSVTISDRDKADIADFADFRKRAFGTLRIVNEGGLPVDTAYQELHSMAPDLFPESITHPADQLVRMYDAARSIQVTEKTVQDYFGKYEPEYRRGAKADFETVIQNATGELWQVKRYAEDKAAKESEAAPATEAEAMEAYKSLKAARRTYERAAAKNLLSSHDEMQVGRLLRHEMELEHLDPEKDNVKGITAVYEAKKEYERLCKLVGEYKRHLRGKARKEADALLETANDWKDKKMGIAYSRETMERNIFDIIKDKKLAQRVIDKYFTPVHVAEAAATRFKNEYRNRVRAMDLSRKVAKGNLVSEAHAVQLLGEAEDNIRMLENTRGRIKNRDGKNLSEWRAVVQQLWEENPNLDKGKIEKAVKDFRYIYDALFQKMNQVRVANGYEPVNYRNGYFPHFQPGDSDSILAQFGRALGIDTRIDALPTTINGLTHTFKPGIQWFGNAQERLGFSTAYDAVEGFDKYIEGVASVIHHTANIQNLRAFASQIRYRTSDEGIRKQVDEIYERQGISDEEKQQLISEIYAHGKFTLSNFVTELDEYTNLLANKKSRYDRSIEAAMGRRAYTVLKAWEARVGANMIAGNLTSALTNFIPLTQAGAQMDRFALLHGMLSTLQAYRADDGIVGMSTFLTNRRGSDPLVQTWAQKASGWAGKPMELIDGFVSDSIVRGAYYQNLKRGMSDAEAMAQADAFASSVMADRSKGAMPTLMQATNPLFKAFTQFQLEVNNQFSEVFKDIPRRFKEKGLKALAWVLLKYFLGAFLYNELYEKLIGRRPALDPIGMLCEAYDDLQNDGFGTAGKNLAVNALEQLPFSSGLTLIGVELDGGRIPASSAVPDLTALWDAATTEGWSAEKRWKEVQDELNKLAYVVPPFGGNQVSKLWKGLKAYIQGGSYTVDAQGRDILQYPVYKDEAGDAFWNLVRAAFLGKSSLPEAQDWVDSGFDGLGAKQTAAYQDMIAAGVKDREAYALIRDLESAKKTETQSKVAIQIGILRNADVSDDGKAIVYYGLVASEKEQELMDSLTDLGADAGAVTNVLMDMRDANALKGSAGTIAKYEAIRKAALTDEEKAVLVGSVMGTDLLTDTGGITQYAKFQYAIHNGMSVDQFISYRNAGANIDNYLEMRDAGASVSDAMEAGIALAELKNSIEDPTTVQKWRTVIDSTNDVQVQLISLSVVMTDSQYRKVQTANAFGVSPSTYVRLNEKLAKYDADGNGSFTQAEVAKAINAMGGSSTVKAVLWQLVTGASSAKNNPYSTEIGQKVIDAIADLKAKEKKPGLTFEEEIMRQIMGR